MSRSADYGWTGEYYSEDLNALVPVCKLEARGLFLKKVHEISPWAVSMLAWQEHGERANMPTGTALNPESTITAEYVFSKGS